MEKLEKNIFVKNKLKKEGQEQDRFRKLKKRIFNRTNGRPKSYRRIKNKFFGNLRQQLLPAQIVKNINVI